MSKTPGQDSETPEYAPGKLIVKLKEGSSLTDIQELNSKYNVFSSDKVFQEFPSPYKTLEELKNELSGIGKEHESWYWQLDKDSKEYKDYAAKIEKEKEDLQNQIKSQEELIAKLEERQKRAPEGQTQPNLENIYILKTNQDTNILQMAEDYKNNPNVEYAEPDYKAKAQMIPNDPYYSSKGSWSQSYDDLWGLKKIQAEKAWDISQGEGIVVAVVDTGIDYNHEDMQANIWVNTREIPNNSKDDDKNGFIDDVKGWDFVNNDKDPMDDHGHGTHCAGIIAAVGNNNKGIIGVAPKAKIMALKGLDKTGCGYTVDLVNCIMYAVNNGADVISNSWGGIYRSIAIEEGLQYAYGKGCVIVVAAGNSVIDTEYSSPAYSKYVITVGGIDHYSSPCFNYGQKVEIMAPGVEILSLRATGTDMYRDGSHIIGGKYYRASGTSMACPHVAGAVALILGKNKTFTIEQVRYVLRNSTTIPPIDTYVYPFYGIMHILNAQKAAAFAGTVPDLCAAIVSPSLTLSFPDNKYIKGMVTIKGDAFGKDFSSYSIEYAEYTHLEPSFIPIIQKTVSVKNGVLGTFNTSTLKDGKYILRLKVNNSSGLYAEDRKVVYIDHTLKDGWPKLIDKWNGIRSMDEAFGDERLTSSLTFADLDNDGDKEIVLIRDNKIYAWNYDGSILNSKFPLEAATGKFRMVPAIGDLDNDNQAEIVMAMDKAKNNNPIIVFHADGSIANGFPAGNPDKNIPGYTYLVGSYPPIITDLEGDGQKDIIAVFGVPNSNYPYLYIIALDNKGLNKKGWPLIISRKSYCKWQNPFAVADLNKDGKQEIVIAISELGPDNLNIGTSYLRIYSYDGQLQKEINFGTNYFLAEQPILIGDVNDDGNLEIFVEEYDSTQQSYGILFDNKLNTRAKFKLPLLRFSWQPYSLVDLDGDRDLEIVGIWGEGYGGTDGHFERSLYAYHHGVIVNGFPKNINMTSEYGGGCANSFSFGSFVLGNIDKSKYTSLFISPTYREGVYGLDYQGNLLDNWPKIVPAPTGACAVDDLDGDGILEIGAYSYDGMVYIWQEYGVRSSWFTICGNNQRTNNYQDQTNATPLFRLNIHRGWNIISLPGTPINSDPNKLCKGKSHIILPLYHFNPQRYSYEEVSELKAGEGYWILSLENDVLGVQLKPIKNISLNLKAGWNMIGGVGRNVGISYPNDTPPGSVKLPVLYYEPAQQNYLESKVIEKGKGYFVKALRDCTLNLGLTVPITSQSTLISSSITAETPWQSNQNGYLVTNVPWNYTMGYKFMPLKNGKITKLGGFFNGIKTVYLWDPKGKILASALVSSNNNWSYSSIGPVDIKKGQIYTVAVCLKGNGGSYRYRINRTPRTYKNIKIIGSCYVYSNGVQYPIYINTNTKMYGQVDIGFVEEKAIEFPPLPF